MNEQRFPELVKELYRVVDELEKMFPGRSFTPDGHMVGSIGEAVVGHHYGVSLCPASNKGCDGTAVDGRRVEIKATQGKSFALRPDCPDHLIAVVLHKEGTFTEIYNGPAGPVWDLVKDRKPTKNGQHRVSVTQLERLQMTVSAERMLPMIKTVLQAERKHAAKAGRAGPVRPVRDGDRPDRAPRA